MDLSDLSKLRVVDLKQELQNRGLDTKGVKAVLIERLREAMSADADGSESNDVEGSSDGGAQEESILPDEESSDARGVTTHSPSPEPPAPPIVDAPEEAILLDESESGDIVMHEVPPEVSPDSTEDVTEVQQENLPPHEAPQEDVKEASPGGEEATPAGRDLEEEEAREEPSSAGGEEELAKKSEEPTEGDNEKKCPEEADDSAVDAYTQNETMPMDEVEKKAKEEEEAKKAAENEPKDDKKRRRSPSPDTTEGSSRRRPRHDSQTAHADDFMNIEDEPALPEDPSLSWVDSDLHMKISGTDFCEARTLSDGVLGLMWAGARATHGVTTGKVFYEVQLQQKNSRVNFPDEKNLFDLRCGWSTLKTDLHLGQTENSFAYDAEGRKVHAGTEEDFGVKFTVGDVIGVYLDMESESCKIQFTVNGEDQGVAFEFEKEKLAGEALFPHISTKNITFKVNFGQLENTLLSDYVPRKRHQEKPKEEAEKKDTEKKAADGEEVKKDGETPETAESKPEEDAAQVAEAKPEDGQEGAPKDDTAEPKEGGEEPTAAEEDKKTDAETKDEKENMEVDEQEEVPEKPINRETLPEYTFISRLPREELVEGLKRVASRKECEVIMMIGLPGSGKTHWVTKWNEEHPEMRYNIIGNNYLYDRMNRGKTSKSEKFNDMCNRSFTVLQELAQKRRRNYIFDQTNVYASAQRRKMKGFGDFKRIAVIVIPDDEEYKRRVASKNEGGSKELADYAVNEMKANFSLPTLDLAWFDEIKYVELEEEAATKLVQDYIDRAKKALPQKRRPYEDNRDHYGNDRRWDRGDRRERWDMGGYRGPSGWRPPPPRDYYGGGGGGGGYDRRERWNEPTWVSGNRRYERDYRRDYGSRDYPRSRDSRDSRSGRSGRDQDFRERRSDNRGGGGDNYGSRSSSSRSSRRDYSSSSRDSAGSAKSYGNPAYGAMPPGGAAMAAQGGAAWGGWQQQPPQQQQWPMAGNWGAQGWNQGGWSTGGAQNWGGWDQWSGQAANGAEWNTASWDVNQAAYTTNSCPNVDPASGQTN
uniref:Uncharacterized protein n=1 Tax=Lutzomyia longipalpis TaxID=7200 RepID=A0A1B0CS09_LUTLO